MSQNPDYQPETVASRTAHRDEVTGAVLQPIQRSVMFRYGHPGAPDELRYSRFQNTPNHEELERRLAALEHTEASVVTGSGMGAIGCMFLSLLSAGDHIVALDSLYGGTATLLEKELPRFGIEVSRVPIDGDYAGAIKDNTRLFHAESVTNPLLRIPEHDKIVEVCKARGVVTSIDNTFASPVNFNPIDVGYDLVVHSATKYINGHADVTAGVVCGSSTLIEPVRDQVKRWGPMLDPQACYLLERGMKTVFVRVERQNRTAVELAKWLAEQPGVKAVYQPGLESHPDHARAQKYLRGPTGMLTFELADEETAVGFLSKLKLVIPAPSLGGIETNATRPVNTSQAGQDEATLRKQGITPGLIRVSCGLEASSDLRADLQAAMG